MHVIQPAAHPINIQKTEQECLVIKYIQKHQAGALDFSFTVKIPLLPSLVLPSYHYVYQASKEVRHSLINSKMKNIKNGIFSARLHFPSLPWQRGDTALQEPFLVR